MLSYCLKCRKTTEGKNQKVVKTKNERIMVTSNYVVCVCDSKRSRFIKEQEPSRLISSLGIRTPLNQISLVGPVLF